MRQVESTGRQVRPPELAETATKLSSALFQKYLPGGCTVVIVVLVRRAYLTPSGKYS